MATADVRVIPSVTASSVRATIAALAARGVPMGTVSQAWPSSGGGEEDELWAGAGEPGATRVRSGPDSARFYATAHFKEDHQADLRYGRSVASLLAVFLGCWDSEEQADSAISDFDFISSEGDETQQYVAAMAKVLPASHRDLDQLRASLLPCGNGKCDAMHCVNRCGGCGHVFFCSRECQVVAWPGHKKE